MDPEADAHEKSPEKSPTRSIAETRRASWCAVGVFCCLVATMVFLNSVACFRLIYRHRIFPNHTPFQLSWIFSVQRACLWAFGPLYGRLCDMYGPRVVIWPLAGTCAVQVFAMSLFQNYWYMMETQGILFGIAAGGVYTASLVSMGQWFDRRLGLVAGIAACGSSLGGIVYPLLLQCAMEQANFENAMQYTALLIGIVLLPALFLIKERLPITGWNRNAKWFDLTPFRQRHYPYFVVGSLLTMWGYWAPIDYIMEYALDSGSSPLFALLLLPSMSAASIPGHVIFGHLGDRLGHDAVLTFCSFGLGASFCILWVPLNYTQSAAGIFVFTLAFGFLSGGFISLLMPCVARLGSAETLGQRFGSFQFFMAISCLTGLPIMEAIRTLRPGYLLMQLFASGSIVFGSAFFILASPLPRTDV